MSSSFPPPTPGASLILSFRMLKKTMLIIGGDVLAASRAYAALEADAHVTVLLKGGQPALCDELKHRAAADQVQVIDWASLLPPVDAAAAHNAPPTTESEIKRDIAALDDCLASNPSISLVCVTDTLGASVASPTYKRTLAPHIARLCRDRRIPVNITDLPDLCDFSFTASHRFSDPSTGAKTALQVGVTTNGEGCRLGGRVRRDIVAALSKEVGCAVAKVGQLRRLARDEHVRACAGSAGENEVGEEEEEQEEEGGEDSAITTPNRPVPMRCANAEETKTEAAKRRMKWVAQVSEYWPISRLAAMTEAEMRGILNGGVGPGESEAAPSYFPIEEKSQHGLSIAPSLTPPKKKGRILLVGSGPGLPSLLTLATHNALTTHADLVLSDKLVPSAVLDLIPAHTQVRIARKFPGNADGAQTEMMEAAVEAANRGLCVVRLKQGDPSVYGRAGEEILYFRARGYEPLVIPGVSSALAAPTFAGIPVTQRGVAESLIVCTGVGRGGKEVRMPGYERGRTVVVLMGVARLGEVVGALIGASSSSPSSLPSPPSPHKQPSEAAQDTDAPTPRQGRRSGAPYPPHTPIAIIERASMPDQRVLLSTLVHVEAGLASLGEQRPPGMMVIGWACLALSGAGELGVLRDGDGVGQGEKEDEERVGRWLGGRRWVVREGIDEGWKDL
ncbi:hypothetical protein HYDPIDRAFT_115845 [Hydnomerulius pinastri MD-312]|uniref:Unplaced genomic scaffold scaffold_28, whole genome shotgun sequence n=1 Tax=Hydnomerulius pinastri MD-312 TaxID=994086 RepID=A0A0C9W4I7_9AGAM|nr:hypothetical protein HYDPIDRAFT_115845 [Hydnomerulius pinastri MD-312]